MNTSPGLHGAGLGGYRKAWTGITTVAAALCALAALAALGPAFTLVLLSLMAGLGSCYGAALGPLLPSLRRPVLTGAAAYVCATAAVVGIALAPGVWGLSVVLLLLATAPPVVSRLVDVARRGSCLSAPPDPAPLTLDGPDEFERRASEELGTWVSRQGFNDGPQRRSRRPRERG